MVSLAGLFSNRPRRFCLLAGLALGAIASPAMVVTASAETVFEFGGFDIPKDIARELRRHGVEVPEGRQKARISVREGRDGHDVRLRLFGEDEAVAREEAPRGSRKTARVPAPPLAEPSRPVEPVQPAPDAGRQAALPPAEPLPAPVQSEAVPEPKAAETGPLGEWHVADRSARIAIGPCGENRLCGKVAWSKTNERLGTEILQTMRPAGDKTWEGRILDPRSGKIYESTMVLKGADTLRVEGCVMGFLCGGETWTRVR